MSTTKGICPVAKANFNIEEFNLWKKDNVITWYNKVISRKYNSVQKPLALSTIISNAEIVNSYMRSQNLEYEVVESNSICTILNYGGKNYLMVPSQFVEFLSLPKREKTWQELSCFSEEDVSVMPLFTTEAKVSEDISNINSKVDMLLQEEQAIITGKHPKIVELKTKIKELKVELAELSSSLHKTVVSEREQLISNLDETKQNKEIISRAKYSSFLTDASLNRFVVLRTGADSFDTPSLTGPISIEEILSRLILCGVDVDSYSSVEELFADEKIDITSIVEKGNEIALVSIPQRLYHKAMLKTSIMARCQFLHQNDVGILFRSGENLSMSWVNSSLKETGLTPEIKASITGAISASRVIRLDCNVEELFNSFVPIGNKVRGPEQSILSLFTKSRNFLNFNKEFDKVVFLKDFIASSSELLFLQKFGRIVEAELKAGIYELGKYSCINVNAIDTDGMNRLVRVGFNSGSNDFINLHGVTRKQVIEVLDSPIYNWNTILKTNISSLKIKTLLELALVELEQISSSDYNTILKENMSVANHPNFEEILVDWKLSTAKRLNNPSSIKMFISYAKKRIKKGI